MVSRVMPHYRSTSSSVLSVPWDYPDLSNRSVTTSPFTIVFQLAGSSKHYLLDLDVATDHDSSIEAAASFMNTVVLTSVLSAGNHALFAGTRVLYGPWALSNTGLGLMNPRNGHIIASSSSGNIFLDKQRRHAHSCSPVDQQY